jgi:transposase
MIGTKVREFKTHENISLGDLVPENNFYRQLEECISLEFIREKVEGLYSNIGRPSIDPVVFFKLQLITFFEGVRSERKLMEMVNLNLAHRWYLGYDFDEALPDHSSLSKIRDRFGLNVFQFFFEKIVEQCVRLVWCGEKNCILTPPKCKLKPISTGWWSVQNMKPVIILMSYSLQISHLPIRSKRWSTNSMARGLPVFASHPIGE